MFLPFLAIYDDPFLTIWGNTKKAVFQVYKIYTFCHSSSKKLVVVLIVVVVVLKLELKY